MNTIARRSSGVLLTLVLLVLPAAAAQGEPATGAPGRWITSWSDLLGDLLDGVLSMVGASQTGDDTGSAGEGGDEPAPTVVPTAFDESDLSTTTRLAPGWDPYGMV